MTQDEINNLRSVLKEELQPVKDQVGDVTVRLTVVEDDMKSVKGTLEVHSTTLKTHSDSLTRIDQLVGAVKDGQDRSAERSGKLEK